jgi:hypothetical protein
LDDITGNYPILAKLANNFTRPMIEAENPNLPFSITFKSKAVDNSLRSERK